MQENVKENVKGKKCELLSKKYIPLYIGYVLLTFLVFYFALPVLKKAFAQ